MLNRYSEKNKSEFWLIKSQLWEKIQNCEIVTITFFILILQLDFFLKNVTISHNWDFLLRIASWHLIILNSYFANVRYKLRIVRKKGRTVR